MLARQLIKACQRGDVYHVTSLLATGCVLNKLCYLARPQHRLQHGVTPDSALEAAAIYGSAQIVAKLLNAGADASDGRALLLAARNNNDDCVELLSHGVTAEVAEIVILRLMTTTTWRSYHINDVCGYYLFKSCVPTQRTCREQNATKEEFLHNELPGPVTWSGGDLGLATAVAQEVLKWLQPAHDF